MRNKYVLILMAGMFLLALNGCAGSQHKKIEQARALRELGKEYYLAGEHTMALRQLLEAENLYPNDHLLQNYLGLVYLAKKQYEQAAEHFQKAVDLKPDFSPAKNSLGVAYLSLGRYDDAIVLFQELTRDLLYGTPHYPLTNMGFAYYKKKQYRLAEQSYKDALDIEPKYHIALRGLGRTYMAMGRYQEAIASLKEAVKVVPEFVDAYFDLGKAYLIIRDYRQALLAFEKVAALEPDSKQGKLASEYAAKLSRFR